MIRFLSHLRKRSRARSSGQGTDSSMADQLQRARRSLRRTQIRCTVAVLVLLAYMSIVTVNVRNRFLRPKPAAALASQCISSLFGAGSQPVSRSSAEESPSLAARLLPMPFAKPTGDPDPSANASPDSLQGLKTAIVTHANEFLASNPEKVHELVQLAKNPKTVEQLGNDLDAEIREHLPSKDRSGLPDAAYLDYLCQTMAALSQLEWQLDRLARGNDLNAYEKTLRRVIAATMGGTGSLS